MAKEKRLIDGNELYRKLSGLNMALTGIRSGKSMLNVFLKEYLKGVLDTVEAQPTVDAVEVVHGRWETWFVFRRCSVCHLPFGIFANWDYCPNCGAKMDGEA